MSKKHKPPKPLPCAMPCAKLPEECIAIMVSLTSPRDACRLSAVSSTFRSAAESDIVWVRFLPSDYCSLLSRAIHPIRYTSKRELFFLLSGRHILVDRGKMVCAYSHLPPCLLFAKLNKQLNYEIARFKACGFKGLVLWSI